MTKMCQKPEVLSKLGCNSKVVNKRCFYVVIADDIWTVTTLLYYSYSYHGNVTMCQYFFSRGASSKKKDCLIDIVFQFQCHLETDKRAKSKIQKSKDLIVTFFSSMIVKGLVLILLLSSFLPCS